MRVCGESVQRTEKGEHMDWKTALVKALKRVSNCEGIKAVTKNGVEISGGAADDYLLMYLLADMLKDDECELKIGPERWDYFCKLLHIDNKILLTQEEVESLPDGTELCVTEVGEEWEEDYAIPKKCIKVGDRLYEVKEHKHSADYNFYLISDMNYKGYELEIQRW